MLRPIFFSLPAMALVAGALAQGQPPMPAYRPGLGDLMTAPGRLSQHVC